MANSPRKVEQIVKPDFVIEGADVLLRRSFGPSRVNPFDPFLLFDHFAFNDPIEGPITGFPRIPTAGLRPSLLCWRVMCVIVIAWETSALLDQVMCSG